MVDDIRYESFNPRRNPEKLSALVTCYQNVFADEPWNEWKKCGVCNKKWGNRQQAELACLDFSHCGCQVNEFWPADVVCADIINEVTDKASCWVACQHDSIIGFSWGYPIEADALGEKLKLPGVASSLVGLFGPNSRIGYQDEIGVRGDYRGKGVAKMMFRHRLNDFRRMGLNVGVVRTKTRPASVTNLWFMKLGYRIVGEYNDTDGRVVLERSLEGL